MVIDEKGQNALTRYRGGKIVKADHNMLKLEIDLKFDIEGEHDRTEMFNLRDKVCQQQFKVFTTDQRDLLNVFPQKKHLRCNSKIGKNSLKSHCMQTFVKLE